MEAKIWTTLELARGIRGKCNKIPSWVREERKQTLSLIFSDVPGGAAEEVHE